MTVFFYPHGHLHGVIPVSVGDQLGKLDPLVTIHLPSLKSPFLLPWPSVQVVQIRRAFSRRAPDGRGLAFMTANLPIAEPLVLVYNER